METSSSQTCSFEHMYLLVPPLRPHFISFTFCLRTSLTPEDLQEVWDNSYPWGRHWQIESQSQWISMSSCHPWADSSEIYTSRISETPLDQGVATPCIHFSFCIHCTSASHSQMKYLHESFCFKFKLRCNGLIESQFLHAFVSNTGLQAQAAWKGHVHPVPNPGPSFSWGFWESSGPAHLFSLVFLLHSLLSIPSLIVTALDTK
jgi:hypothetical protein